MGEREGEGRRRRRKRMRECVRVSEWERVGGGG